MNKVQLFKANAGLMQDGGFAGFGWPTAKVKKADALVDRVRKRHTAAAIAMIENGRDLIELKALCEHGEFEAALAVKIGVSSRYAQMQMAAYQWARQNNLIDANTHNCSHLENIDVLAIRLLASKKGSENTPQAIRLAEQGRKVTESLVKSWIAQGTEPKRIESKAKASVVNDGDQVAQAEPEGARDQVGSIRQSMTDKQRLSFDKKFDAAVLYEVNQQVIAEVDAELKKQREALAVREAKLNSWAADLSNREADLTVHMTELEYKMVIGCLHPDRAGNDEVLQQKLTKAFNIFRRLEPTTKHYPVSVLRERGWA